MIAVSVAQQHDVDVGETCIIPAGDGVAGVVQDSDAGWILEDRGTVPIA